MEDDDDEGCEVHDQEIRRFELSGLLDSEKHVDERQPNGVRHSDVSEPPVNQGRRPPPAEYPTRADEVLSSSPVVPAPCPLVTRENITTAISPQPVDKRSVLQGPSSSKRRFAGRPNSSNTVPPAPGQLVSRENTTTAISRQSANKRGLLQGRSSSRRRVAGRPSSNNTEQDTVPVARQNAANKNKAQRASSQSTFQDTAPDAGRESAMSALEDLETLLASPP